MTVVVKMLFKFQSVSGIQFSLVCYTVGSLQFN